MNFVTSKKINFQEPENPLFKEAATIATKGIIEQQKGNYEEAKKYIQESLNKLKQITLNGKNDEKEKANNYYSLFQGFLSNCQTQEENDKTALKSNVIQNLILKDKQFENGSENNFLSLLKEYPNEDKSSIDDILNYTTKIFDFFAKANERGFFWSKDIFIRKEIFYQENAKIPFLHQKYDVYKNVAKKISDLRTLVESDVISGDNIDGFINYLIDVQNWFSRETKYISACRYRKNPNNNVEINKTQYLFQKFQDIKNKVENNVLSEKIMAINDFIRKFVEVCNSFKELKDILDAKYYKGEFLNNLNHKKKEICDIFYNCIIKMFIRDALDLAKRFIRKQFLNFESYKVPVK